MINILFSRICILTFGTLFPCYISFKTIRAENVDEYVKWIMYWIMFGLFIVSETFTDIFLTWFPFYYELKVLFILWLLPTMGNGSTSIYTNCVHPLLEKHESVVDQHLEEVKQKGKDLVIQYIKEAALYIIGGIINVVNKGFPNGISGFLASSVSQSVLSVQGSNNLIVEEEEIKVVPKNKATLSKKSKHSTTSDTDEPESSHRRRRKTRRAEPETDCNSNQSEC